MPNPLHALSMNRCSRHAQGAWLASASPSWALSPEWLVSCHRAKPLALKMAGARNGRGGGARRRNRRRNQQIPRPMNTGCVVRRAFVYGNLSYPGAADGGLQIGITPTAILDWSAYASVWQRFRVLSATIHFTVWGQNDTTPGYTTVYVYHDTISSGAPATILDALVRKGRKILPLSVNKIHQQFTFKPMVWTSSGLNLTTSARNIWMPTASPVALTSAAAWLQNYNSTSQAPGINVNVELVLHFDSPQ